MIELATVHRVTAIAILAVLLMTAPLPADAHLFPLRASPPVGSTLQYPPAAVRIHFDGELEPAFSRVEVRDAQGKIISGESRVGTGSKVLETRLPPLKAGTYHVYWRVVGHDGHATQGDYRFSMNP